MTDIPTITVHDLSEALASSTPPIVLDVREPAEVAQSSLAGALHIPLAQLTDRLEELEALDPETPIAVLCRVGGRSARATAFLLQQGFNAVNIEGGMAAWVAEIDPSLPTP